MRTIFLASSWVSFPCSALLSLGLLSFFNFMWAGLMSKRGYGAFFASDFLVRYALEYDKKQENHLIETRTRPHAKPFLSMLLPRVLHSFGTKLFSLLVAFQERGSRLSRLSLLVSALCFFSYGFMFRNTCHYCISFVLRRTRGGFSEHSKSKKKRKEDAEHSLRVAYGFLGMMLEDK